MLSHDTWLRYKDKLSVKDLPKELAPLYSVLDNFHQQHAVDLTIGDLANLTLATVHRDPEYYRGVLQQLETIESSEATAETLMQSFYEQRLLKELSLAAYDLTEGRGKRDDFLQLLNKFTDGQTDAVEHEEFEFVTDDLEQLLQDTYRKPGLRWRLNTLNRMLGSLRGGDFGFIFARPETGKTTFLASETTYMASQLTEDQGPVIWFNNEEANKKVRIRCFQGALGATLAQINSNPTAARNAFLKATHGKHVLLDNDGSISKSLIERVCRKHKPSLVVVDQLDKVTGFDADREDLKMGAIYQWKRDLGKELDHATIGVCQADGSGEGQKWLTMANVANAKTAKQAEADFILGIGKVSDVGYEQLRYLHASKNKLSGDEDSDPTMRHGRAECIIEPSTARYLDIK